METLPTRSKTKLALHPRLQVQGSEQVTHAWVSVHHPYSDHNNTPLLWKFKGINAHWLHSSRSKIRAQCIFLTMVISTGKDWAEGQSRGCAILGDTGNGDDCVLRVWCPRPDSTQLSLPNVQQVKRKPALLEFCLGGRTCTLNAGETAYLQWLLWPRALGC